MGAFSSIKHPLQTVKGPPGRAPQLCGGGFNKQFLAIRTRYEVYIFFGEVFERMAV
jgi:hypothetical protein